MARRNPPRGSGQGQTSGSAAAAAKAAALAKQKAERLRVDARQTSLEAGRALQRILDQAPGAQITHTADPATKRSAERVLELARNLNVHVPQGEVTPADVERRLRDTCHMLSFVRPRGHREKIEMGDEALVDMLGYIAGEPFIARTDVWSTITPNPLLPGLFEGLVGARIPDNRLVQVSLPANYPVESQANAIAVFAVTIKQARVRVLANPDEPEFLILVNRGAKTLDDLMLLLRDDLVRERAMSMVEHAKLLMLRLLYIQCIEDPVPDELVEDELAKRWRDFQGASMMRQGVSIEEQQRSSADFGSDDAQRAEARRTVWETRILEALADAHGLHAREPELMAALQAMVGNDVDVSAYLYKNPGLHKDLLRGLKAKKATELLLKLATISFDIPPGSSVSIPSLIPEDVQAARVVTAARGLARPPSKAPPPKR